MKYQEIQINIKLPPRIKLIGDEKIDIDIQTQETIMVDCSKKKKVM